MTIRSIGVQYISNNLQIFIESNSDHSWLRYLVYTCMAHQDTWADAIAIQAVAS